MKCLLKTVANLLSQVLVLPAVALCLAAGTLGNKAAAFAGWSQFFSLFPGTGGAYLRRAFYQLTLRSCGTGAWISFGTLFSHPHARLGHDVYIGPFCSLGAVTLEDDVLVSSHVSIINGGRQHGFSHLDCPVREQPGAWPHVTVGRDSWIGERAVILANVGRHCIVGAGAVVTSPVPDYAVVAGVPARILRERRQIVPISLEAMFPEHQAPTSSVPLSR